MIGELRPEAREKFKKMVKLYNTYREKALAIDDTLDSNMEFNDLYRDCVFNYLVYLYNLDALEESPENQKELKKAKEEMRESKKEFKEFCAKIDKQAKPNKP